MPDNPQLKLQKMPYAPPPVAIDDLESNGKLCPNTQIQWLVNTLSHTDHYYTRKELNERRPQHIPKFLYSIDMQGGTPYAVYQDPEKDKRNSAKLLGKGGQSKVKPAQNLLTGEFFALRTGLDPDDIEQEFQYLQKLKLGVARGIRNQQGRILMKYIPGPNMSKLAKRQFQSSKPGYWLDIFIDIAKQLEIIHAAGIIHCDIKRENIVFDSATRTAKIIDFGLARKPTAASTIHAGTLSYMAPESLKQGSYTEKSDIYSLGLTLEKILHLGLFKNKSEKLIQQHCDLMMHKNPDMRPTLKETIKFLKSVKFNKLLLDQSILNIIVINLSEYKYLSESMKRKLIDSCDEMHCDEVQFVSDGMLSPIEYMTYRRDFEAKGIVVKNKVITPVDQLALLGTQLERNKSGYLCEYFYLTTDELSYTERASLTDQAICPLWVTKDNSDRQLRQQETTYRKKSTDLAYAKKIIAELAAAAFQIKQSSSSDKLEKIAEHISFAADELVNLLNMNKIDARVIDFVMHKLSLKIEASQPRIKFNYATNLKHYFDFINGLYRDTKDTIVHTAIVMVSELSKLSPDERGKLMDRINLHADEIIFIHNPDRNTSAETRWKHGIKAEFEARCKIRLVENAATDNLDEWIATLTKKQNTHDYVFFTANTETHTRLNKKNIPLLNPILFSARHTEALFTQQLTDFNQHNSIPTAKLNTLIVALETDRARLLQKYQTPNPIVIERTDHILRTIVKLTRLQAKNPFVPYALVDRLLESLARKMTSTNRMKNKLSALTGIRFYGDSKEMITQQRNELKAHQKSVRFSR